MVSMGRQITSTNDAFFIQQIQNINVTANDAQLVDFLYKLGSSASMIRVLDLELQPDPAKHNLVANIRLVASYQKKSAACLHQCPTCNQKGKMKTTPILLLLLITASGLWAQTPPPAGAPVPAPVRRACRSRAGSPRFPALNTIFPAWT